MLEKIIYDYSKSVAYIYYIWFKKHGYIGSTINPRQRILTHLSELKNNNHKNKILQSAYNKYGIDSLKVKVIATCDVKDRNSVEEFYINKSNYDTSYNILGNCDTPILPFCVNKKFSKDQIEEIFSLIKNGATLISVAKLFNTNKEHIRGIIFKKNYFYESKNIYIDLNKYKIDRNKNKSIAQIKNNKFKMFMYKTTGEFIGEYDSITEVINLYGFKRSNITNSLYRNQSHNGYMFFKEKQDEIKYRQKSGNPIVIFVFNNEFKLINKFKSMIECADFYKIKSNAINSNCCRLNINNSTKNYYVREYQLDKFKLKYSLI